MNNVFMDQTEERIRQLLAEIAGMSPQASSNADLYLDLGVASVHALQLLSALENQFGVAVPDDDFVEATSIERLTVLMKSLAGNGTPSRA